MFECFKDFWKLLEGLLKFILALQFSENIFRSLNPDFFLLKPQEFFLSSTSSLLRKRTHSDVPCYTISLSKYSFASFFSQIIWIKMFFIEISQRKKKGAKEELNFFISFWEYLFKIFRWCLGIAHNINFNFHKSKGYVWWWKIIRKISKSILKSAKKGLSSNILEKIDWMSNKKSYPTPKRQQKK